MSISFGKKTIIPPNYLDTQNIQRLPIGQKIIATSNQTVFNLDNSYEVGKKVVSVEVDGVPQILGDGFIETSSTSITLTEGVPAGAVVKVTVFQTPIGVDTKIGDISVKTGNLSNLQTSSKSSLVDAINEHTSQLAEKASQSEISDLVPTIPSAKLQKVKQKISLPTGMVWDGKPVNVYKDGVGNISTDFNIASYKPVTTGVTYYVATNGLSTNDGLTPATPLDTVAAACDKADVNTIVIASGYYDADHSFASATHLNNKQVVIKAADGADVTLSASKAVSWSKTAGQANVYQCSRTIVDAVYDSNIVDANGDFQKLTPVASIALCDSTPGSYYYATPMLYIHASDHRAADTKIKVFVATLNLNARGNCVIYCENIKFHGGNNGAVNLQMLTTADYPLFIANNCEFKYATGTSAGGLTNLGGDTILQNCVAAQNANDGFNHHIFMSRIPRSIEINCVGRHNGIGSGAQSDNGSTTHDGGKIIRINCIHNNNEGYNVADVGTGTQSWTLGNESFNSVCTIPAGNTCYMVGTGATMWLDTCIGYGSINKYYVEAGSTLNIKNVAMAGNQVNSGTINKY